MSCLFSESWEQNKSEQGKMKSSLLDFASISKPLQFRLWSKFISFSSAWVGVSAGLFSPLLYKYWIKQQLSLTDVHLPLEGWTTTKQALLPTALQRQLTDYGLTWTGATYWLVISRDGGSCISSGLMEAEKQADNEETDELKLGSHDGGGWRTSAYINGTQQALSSVNVYYWIYVIFQIPHVQHDSM